MSYRCLGCTQKVHPQKARLPNGASADQCPRCLVFRGYTALTPPQMGGPVGLVHTYQVMGGKGLVTKQLEREAPLLARVGWIVASQATGGQMRSFFQTVPAYLTVSFTRAQGF